MICKSKRDHIRNEAVTMGMDNITHALKNKILQKFRQVQRMKERRLVRRNLEMTERVKGQEKRLCMTRSRKKHPAYQRIDVNDLLVNIGVKCSQYDNPLSIKTGITALNIKLSKSLTMLCWPQFRKTVLKFLSHQRTKQASPLVWIKSIMT